MANPDGTYTLTQSTTPQRARAEDGSWQSIDTTLEWRTDGTVGPKAAVVDLSFSGGGSGKDMIRLAGSRGAIELGWPDALPKPVLDGPMATYPEVYTGVDLQLTATAEGFREVLVVKSAEAAANPELQRISLSAQGDGLTIVPGAGGGLRALDGDGNAVFAGPAGVMWDSAGDAGVQPQLLRTAEAGEPTEGMDESAEGAGDPTQPEAGDATAVLPVQVADGSVSVVPDQALLRGKDTVYPVYIDPPIGVGASEKSVISSDGDRWWQFSGDYGVGRCYRVGPWYCDADHTNRMLFEFAPTKLTGMHVLDATFRAYETWSFSCTPHWVDLVRTNNMSEATRWPGPTQIDLMGDRDVSAGRGTNCSPEQPDSWVEFNDNPAEPDENLTATVRNFADGKFSRLTLMLRAKDESDPDAWKRFDDNAELKVVYVPKPYLPNNVGVIPGYGTDQFCGKTPAEATAVTRTDPTIQGMVQTQQQPQGNESLGSLRALFHTEYQKPDGTWAKAFSVNVPDPGSDPDDTLEKFRIDGVADGALYRFNVLTESYWTWGTANGKLSSGRSAWCYFKVDTQGPKAPQILSGPGNDYTSRCSEDWSCVAQGGPGKAGVFNLKPNAADADVTAYQWWMQEGSATTVAKAVGEFTTIYPKPLLAGTHRLFVRAKDVRDRWGDTAVYRFKVDPGAKPSGQWKFAENTGTTAADSATQGAVRYPATLKQPQPGTAGWSDRGRRGANDYSLALNETVTDPAKQVGYAETAAPVVDTKDSFTVSAWVYLTDGTANRAVLSAPGARDTAFTLYYSPTKKTWAFNRGSRDGDDAVDIVTAGTQPAALRVWTHLTAVFDTKGDALKTNDTIQLFINGRPQGPGVTVVQQWPEYEPWTATSGLQFGRTKIKGVFQQPFRGSIDEVAVWQRALTADEVPEQAQMLQDGVAATELIAHWDPTVSTGTEVKQQVTGYQVAPLKLSTSGAALGGADEGLVLDGMAGYASMTGPLVDETGSFTVSARVKLDKAKLDAKPVGYRGQVFGQASSVGAESSWALWVEKVSADGYLWRFGRTATDGSGSVLESASVPSGLGAEMDTWVQVTGVFSPSEPFGTGLGKTHLYVSAEDQPSEDKAGFQSATQGSGALAAGRGPAGGTTGHYLPGGLQDLRVWAGAMSADQVATILEGGVPVSS